MELPDWAEPSKPSTKQSMTPAQDEAITNDPPNLPGDRTPIPVDGGLSLLALAGAGYAARKLRGGNGEDHDLDRDDIA